MVHDLFLEFKYGLADSMRMFACYFPRNLGMQEIIPCPGRRKPIEAMFYESSSWTLGGSGGACCQETSVSVLQFRDGSVAMLIGIQNLTNSYLNDFRPPSQFFDPHWFTRGKPNLVWQDKLEPLPKKNVVTPFAKLQIAAQKRMESSLKRAAMETYFSLVGWFWSGFGVPLEAK